MKLATISHPNKEVSLDNPELLRCKLNLHLVRLPRINITLKLTDTAHLGSSKRKNDQTTDRGSRKPMQDRWIVGVFSSETFDILERGRGHPVLDSFCAYGTFDAIDDTGKSDGDYAGAINE